MAVFTKKANRAQISYAESEAPYYQKIETELMQELNIPSRSGLQVCHQILAGIQKANQLSTGINHENYSDRSDLL